MGKKHYVVSSLTVSMPLHMVMVNQVSLPLKVPTLYVSLPRSVYLSTPLETLRRRVDLADILPHGELDNF